MGTKNSIENLTQTVMLEIRDVLKKYDFNGVVAISKSVPETDQVATATLLTITHDNSIFIENPHNPLQEAIHMPVKELKEEGEKGFKRWETTCRSLMGLRDESNTLFIQLKDILAILTPGILKNLE